MTIRYMVGTDGRKYKITSETDLADKVISISANYIEIDADLIDTVKDKLCVELVKPEPLSAVGMKDLILKPKDK